MNSEKPFVPMNDQHLGVIVACVALSQRMLKLHQDANSFETVDGEWAVGAAMEALKQLCIPLGIDYAAEIKVFIQEQTDQLKEVEL